MARKFTTHPDQDYDVIVCRNCKHPGGQHRLNDGCRLCASPPCPGWDETGGIARWNDAMTREAKEHAGITREGEEWLATTR